MPETEPAHTFLFVDLAGFTALTEAMGDQDAAQLARDFAGKVNDLLLEHGAEAVQEIGDAVMIRADEAAAAVGLALCVVHDVGGQHFFPTVRAGMHTGQAVAHGGDWFGSTVNIAARISGVAGGGEVLLSAATREAAGEIEAVEFREHGRQALKNVTEPILLYAALRQGGGSAAGLPVDPVCHMAVDPEHAAGTVVHAGSTFHFCSHECIGRFVASPELYAPAGR